MELPMSAVLEDAALLVSGNSPPSVLLPWMYGTMTRIAPLERTLEGARRVRKYGDGPLPDKDTFFEELKGSGLPFFGSAWETVTRIEQVVDESWLDMGKTLEEQREFRRTHLGRIKGLKPKTFSMGMLCVLGPECWVIPVDRWHLRLLGMPEHSPGKIETYEAIEDLIIEKLKDEGIASEPYGMGAWLRWERARQAAEVSLSPEYGVKVESHADLSIRRR